jgi:hypothetical protein
VGDVVEPAGAHRRGLGEPALHLVGDRERGEQCGPVAVAVLPAGEHGGQVVAGVAGLAGGEVAVVEVEVADQEPVVERGPVGRRAAPPEHRAPRVPADVVEVLGEQPHRVGVDRAQGAAERVEHADLQLLDGRRCQVGERGADREGGELVDDGHQPPPPADGASIACTARVWRARRHLRRASPLPPRSSP